MKVEKYNECVIKKINEYIEKLDFPKHYTNIYIPKYIIKEFEKECDL